MYSIRRKIFKGKRKFNFKIKHFYRIFLKRYLLSCFRQFCEIELFFRKNIVFHLAAFAFEVENKQLKSLVYRKTNFPTKDRKRLGIKKRLFKLSLNRRIKTKRKTNFKQVFFITIIVTKQPHILL